MNITKKLKNSTWLVTLVVFSVLAASIVATNFTVFNDSVSADNDSVSPQVEKNDDDKRPATSILPNDLDVIGLLKFVIWVMTAGVGVLAVGGIVWGAILYTSSGQSQENTKKGIEIIKNVVIGLLLYVFMFAIINFLIPGRLIT
jgi:hypothetical protein